MEKYAKYSKLERLTLYSDIEKTSQIDYKTSSIYKVQTNYDGGSSGGGDGH